MLINLRAIHKPQTLEEAASLLNRPGVYPVYGGGASLIYQNNPEIQEAVDLASMMTDQCEFRDGHCWLGSRTTLANIAASDKQLSTIIEAETPLALRYALTLGDVLTECPAHSLVLALLHGLEARVHCHAQEPVPITRWFDMTPDERRQQLIQQVVFHYYPVAPIRFAVEQAACTPGEVPAVAAIGFALGGFRYSTKVSFYCVVCGLADRPILCQPNELSNLQSQISDHKGSAEHRTEVGRRVSQRAMLEAVKLAGQGHW
jgi:CO/xanthine dehydrogenase FAD-binding subunit